MGAPSKLHRFKYLSSIIGIVVVIVETHSTSTNPALKSKSSATHTPPPPSPSHASGLLSSPINTPARPTHTHSPRNVLSNADSMRIER